MNIRQATFSDAPVVAEFNLRLAEETEQLRLDPEVVQAGVAAVLSDPAKGIYFVAESEGVVILNPQVVSIEIVYTGQSPPSDLI